MTSITFDLSLWKENLGWVVFFTVVAVLLILLVWHTFIRPRIKNKILKEAKVLEKPRKRLDSVYLPPMEKLQPKEEVPDLKQLRMKLQTKRHNLKVEWEELERKQEDIYMEIKKIDDTVEILDRGLENGS